MKYFMQRWFKKDKDSMDPTEAEDIKKKWQEYRKTIQKRSS